MNYLILLIFLCVALVNNGYSQEVYTKKNAPKKAQKAFSEANLLINRTQYEQAISLLEDVVDKTPGFIDANIMLADLYQMMRQPDKARQRLTFTLSLETRYAREKVLLSLGSLEKNQGNYKTAIPYLEELLGLKDLIYNYKVKGERLLKTCRFAEDALNNPVPFNPVNMGKSINTPFEEYLPAVTADEQTLIFTRKLKLPTNQYNEDFYISKKIDGKWQPAKNMAKPINTGRNEGAHTISPDGKYLFFTGCNRPGGYGSCDIYFSKREGNTWSSPINIGPPVNTNSWESQPSISADGRNLYFVSNRKDGHGKIDIWVSTLSDKGQFSEPVNLGTRINTKQDDQSPYIHPDNKTLYFSSKGQIGMGEEDLFMVKKDSSGKWGTPKNLGYPINTQGNEFSLYVSADGMTAYFSSDRFGGEGKMDIHFFELHEKARPEPVTYVKGKVFDSQTKKSLFANLELIDLESGTTVIAVGSDKQNGSFLVCLPAGKNYALNVSKKDYLFYSENFSLKNRNPDKPYLMDIALQPIKIGEKVVLKNIFFETASFQLKDESKVELERLVSLLNSNPGISIEISGHTDNVGKEQANMVLSKNRAKAVYDYLISQQIDPGRLTYEGFGDTQPIADNHTEDGRAQNRRTEFKVMGK